MAIWKWGMVAVPAVSGLAIGVQQFNGQSSEELPPPDYLEEENPENWTEEIDDSSEEQNDTMAQEQTFSNKQVNSQGTLNNFFEDPKKQEIKKEADAAFKKLDDYTFKLFSPCSVGTGWVLDYQLPKSTEKYPLVWYIATNAHVVEGWFFDANPYKQKIPRSRLSNRRKAFGSKTDYSLFTDESCKLKGQGFFDINLSKQSDGKERGSDKGAIAQKKMKAPKLFWSAVDLFNRDYSLDIESKNYKDFAVVEIEFTDEQSAREITRNFADKYKLDSTDVINVFADPLDSSKTETNEENFYTLGYPFYKSDSFKQSRNLNEKTLVADRLAKNNKTVFFNLRDRKNINPKGYIGTKPFSNIGFRWGGTKYQRMGHFYLMNGKVSGKGSSGSMYIDGKGNLLGVKSLVEKYGKSQNSMVTPLRSKKMVLEGNFKTPEYDLILGANNQKSSYKKQVEEYLTKYGKKTWLSERGWKNNPKISRS